MLSLDHIYQPMTIERYTPHRRHLFRFQIAMDEEVGMLHLIYGGEVCTWCGA
jgi:hypothetical protein